MRTFAAAVLASLALGPALASETIRIESVRDATLIEDPDGSLANGAGPAFFVGRTGQTTGSVRRALLYFDVNRALPRFAIIERVSLTLYLTPSNPEARSVRCHRVLADWGEGASRAGGGSGAPAMPGDSTWLHTFFDRHFWAHSGAHFVGEASAEQLVGPAGSYSWQSTPRLVRDVRLWLEAPTRNFGWLLIGDETIRQTSKRFASRETDDVSIRPVLEITYRLPEVRRPG